MGFDLRLPSRPPRSAQHCVWHIVCTQEMGARNNCLRFSYFLPLPKGCPAPPEVMKERPSPPNQEGAPRLSGAENYTHGVVSRRCPALLVGCRTLTWTPEMAPAEHTVASRRRSGRRRSEKSALLSLASGHKPLRPPPSALSLIT